MPSNTHTNQLAFTGFGFLVDCGDGTCTSLSLVPQSAQNTCVSGYSALQFGHFFIISPCFSIFCCWPCRRFAPWIYVQYTLWIHRLCFLFPRLENLHCRFHEHDFGAVMFVFFVRTNCKSHFRSHSSFRIGSTPTVQYVHRLCRQSLPYSPRQTPVQNK